MLPKLPPLPRAYLHAWRQHHWDQRDAELMRVYTATRPVLRRDKRALLLAGLSAFQRTLERV